MLLGQGGWDAITVDHHYDVTTKLTALYLLASAAVYVALAVKFLMRVGRTKKLESSQFAERTALANVDTWARLTVLILLAYSATECADLLWLISREKMIGLSALSGSLAQILSMWTAGLWLLVSLWIANWILSGRVTRNNEARESPPQVSN